MFNLTSAGKFTRVLNLTPAGDGDTINSASVDMLGFDRVTFLVMMGAMAAGAAAVVKGQQSHDDGATDPYADLAGTGMPVTNASASKVALLEIVTPQERYVRAVVVRTTNTGNSTIDGIIAIQTGAGVEPVIQSATVLESELFASPAAGTA